MIIMTMVMMILLYEISKTLSPLNQQINLLIDLLGEKQMTGHRADVVIQETFLSQTLQCLSRLFKIINYFNEI